MLSRKWTVCLLLLLVGGCGAPAAAPEEVVRQFMDAMNQNDTTTMWALISDDVKKRLEATAKSKGHPSAEKLLERIGKPSETADYRIVRTRRLPHTRLAQCLVAIKGKDEDKHHVMLLAREAGGWRILDDARSHFTPEEWLLIVQPGEQGHYDSVFVREMIGVQPDGDRVAFVKKYHGQTITLTGAARVCVNEPFSSPWILLSLAETQEANVQVLVQLDEFYYGGNTTYYFDGRKLADLGALDCEDRTIYQDQEITVTGVIGFYNAEHDELAFPAADGSHVHEEYNGTFVVGGAILVQEQ